MENVGCVTFSEDRYLFKQREASFAQRLRFSVSVLHELAHMWFGNLITMKWWDDLWLNESFATYMCFEALSKIQELSYYDTYWATFQLYKFWGVSND